MSHVFHEGERAVQQLAGVADMARRVGNGIHPQMPPAAQEFLTERKFVVLGGADTEGAVWATVLTGSPGFATAPDPHTVVLAALLLPGDPLFARLTQNVESAPVGLLAIDPTTRRRMRVNGDMERVGNGLTLRVRQAYANCPKYIQKREDNTSEPKQNGGREARAAQTASQLTDAQRTWIATSDTFFIATQHPTGGGDASHRGGEPGFVRVEDAHTLLFPDYAGNTMFNTLGNIAVNSKAGLLWVGWETGDTLQITGRADILWDEETARQFAGAERVVRFHIDKVIETKGAVALRFPLRERSPFNPHE